MGVGNTVRQRENDHSGLFNSHPVTLNRSVLNELNQDTRQTQSTSIDPFCISRTCLLPSLACQLCVKT